MSVVVPAEKSKAKLTREEIIARRPKSPKMTVEEYHALLDKYAVSAGGLPEDFSREDIYSDHD